MWTVPGGKLDTGDYVNYPKDTESYWYNVLERTSKPEVNGNELLDSLLRKFFFFLESRLNTREPFFNYHRGPAVILIIFKNFVQDFFVAAF